jgi:hypothetical protein
VLRVKIADYNYFPQVISGAGRQWLSIQTEHI